MRLLDERLPARRGRGLALGALALAAAPLGATVLDPPREYRARGELVATASGPHCCGTTRFTGRFRAAYSVESSGAVRLGGLTFELDDIDVVVHGGFLDLFSEVIHVRCGAGSTPAPALGTTVGPTTLKLPSGSVQLHGGFSDGRDSAGECSEAGISFSGGNTDDVLLVHQPDSDHVELHANFAAMLADGESYVLHLDGDGRFENRPPTAQIVFRYPDGTYPQDGCPLLERHWDGQQWVTLTEANSPQGLIGFVSSNSSDLDGSSSRADIAAERWLDQRDGWPEQRLGNGRNAGPFVFEFGPTHNLGLVARDRTGAASADVCRFRVGDTTPPTVTAPPPLVTPCSTAGGATAATSPPLAGFLAGASASDVVDTTPTALAPQVSGADVTPTTLFPPNVARNVSFRFRDDAGEIGNASSSVTVLDDIPPSLTLALDRPVLQPDFKFWAIAVAPTMSDACGGTLTLRLLSVASNAPAFDAGDIFGAAIGTDDRNVFLFSRPAGPGSARLYTLRYEARDAGGNTRQADVKVTVNASDAGLGDLFATFDATLQAPKCAAAGRSCDSGASLLLGRHTLGPEPNRPNTIHDSCADGGSGVFHSDESNDRLKVSTVDGTLFGAGRLARIEAVVWPFSVFAADHLDLYYAANAATPSWTYITTLTPTSAGPQVLSATYTLPAGPLQAVRARFRYNGSPSPCATGSFDDHDDLIFAVR